MKSLKKETSFEISSAQKKNSFRLIQRAEGEWERN